MNTDNTFLTRTEAAAYLGLPVATLRKFALRGAAGGPPMIRYGYRTVRYQRAALDRWMVARGAILD